MARALFDSLYSCMFGVFMAAIGLMCVWELIEWLWKGPEEQADKADTAGEQADAAGEPEQPVEPDPWDALSDEERAELKHKFK